MMIDVFFGVVLTFTYSSDADAVNQDGFQPCQQYLAQFQFYSQEFSNKVRSQQLQLNSLNRNEQYWTNFVLYGYVRELRHYLQEFCKTTPNFLLTERIKPKSLNKKLEQKLSYEQNKIQVRNFNTH